MALAMAVSRVGVVGVAWRAPRARGSPRRGLRRVAASASGPGAETKPATTDSTADKNDWVLVSEEVEQPAPFDELDEDALLKAQKYAIRPDDLIKRAKEILKVRCMPNPLGIAIPLG